MGQYGPASAPAAKRNVGQKLMIEKQDRTTKNKLFCCGVLSERCAGYRVSSILQNQQQEETLLLPALLPLSSVASSLSGTEIDSVRRLRGCRGGKNLTKRNKRQNHWAKAGVDHNASANQAL